MFQDISYLSRILKKALFNQQFIEAAAKQRSFGRALPLLQRAFSTNASV